LTGLPVPLRLVRQVPPALAAAPRRWSHFVQVATDVVPFITDHLLSPAVMRR
jgi:hypothetical protein